MSFKINGLIKMQEEEDDKINRSGVALASYYLFLD